MAIQIHISDSMDGTLKDLIHEDLGKMTAANGIDVNSGESQEAKAYLRNLYDLLHDIDTKYTRVLEALGQKSNADVAQFARINEDGVLSRYIKGKSSLMELFTALQQGQVEVYNEDAERTYFQRTRAITSEKKPSQRLFNSLERKRYQEIEKDKKQQLAAKKRTLAAELAEYDRAAKERKMASEARRKSKAADIKYALSSFLKFDKTTEYSLVKNDQKDNKKLIKMSEKETKLRRNVLEFARKSELGLLTDREQKKFNKANENLASFLEEKAQFKQQIKDRITEELKNKFDINEFDRDYQVMRFEQLDREDYSYTVLPYDVEFAISNDAFPLDLQGKSQDELTAHYKSKIEIYAPDTQKRLDDKQAAREKQQNYKATRIKEMNDTMENAMFKAVARVKIPPEEIGIIKTKEEQPKKDEKDTAVETQMEEPTHSIREKELDD